MQFSGDRRPEEQQVETAYQLAKQRYADLGVDVERALKQLAAIPVSLHCWQGDDVRGFESRGGQLGGGLAVTGSYPGRARTGDELRADALHAFSLVPTHNLRFNLHASYAETSGRQVDRDALLPGDFESWMQWAEEHGLGLDFNPTFFSHPQAAHGATLSHSDPAIRNFWIDHAIACRRIGAAFGKRLGTPCTTNIWIPDGSKDTPIDRRGPRERLCEALDEVFAEPLPEAHQRDSVESKLFGLGSESYVVGSHEFFLGYAITRQKVLCLDAGHFHPTETISDKLSAVLPWVPRVLLHVSRGVRWDSDHVVTLSDEVREIAFQVVRGDYQSRVDFGLDFFDASINRVAAWVIGTRALLKALLLALLEPVQSLRQAEEKNDLTQRLALLESEKSLPFGPVWDWYCLQNEVPPGHHWLASIRNYESRVLSLRD